MVHLEEALVNANWLNANLRQGNLIVLDATIPKAGQKENDISPLKGIPGSRFFDIKKHFSDKTSSLPNTMCSPDQFEYEARRLGINKESAIVVYDRHGIYSSARVWWMFRAMGHTNVAVLDGGLTDWENEGFQSVEVMEYSGEKGGFIAKPVHSSFCESEAIMKNLKDQSHVVLDARSKDRFNGDIPEPRADLRSGHIPNAINLPYASLQQGGKMKTKKELVELLKTSNPEQKPLYLSCGSGVTACIIALAANIADFHNVSVYDGSWSEWGASTEFHID